MRLDNSDRHMYDTYSMLSLALTDVQLQFEP